MKDIRQPSTESIFDKPIHKSGEKINPMDRPFKRCLTEMQCALILAGGAHDMDLLEGDFKEVLKSLFSNVAEDQMVRIVKDYYQNLKHGY